MICGSYRKFIMVSSCIKPSQPTQPTRCKSNVPSKKNLQAPGNGAWRFVFFFLYIGVLTCEQVMCVPQERLDPGIGFDDINAVNLLAFPLFGLRIKGGINEDLPVLIITGRVI